MIKKLNIINYRSCLNTTLELQPDLSVLIGPNSSGKTNILSAIRLLNILLEERPYFMHRDTFSGKSSLKAWFEIDKKAIFYNALIDIYYDEDNQDVVQLSKQHWIAKAFVGSKKHFRFTLANLYDYFKSRGKIGNESERIIWTWHDQTTPKLTDTIPYALASPLLNIINTIKDIRYYSASQFTNPALCPVSFDIDSDRIHSYTRRPKGHAKFLFDLYEKYKNSRNAVYAEFFNVIGPNGIHLIDNIDFREIKTSSVDVSVASGGKVRSKKKDKLLVIPQFQIGKDILSPNQLSEGTFKTITLLFYLITDESRLLLIEEPEVCVHHGLLSSIIELIKTYSFEKQIVVSTHSDYVLDHVSPRNVYQVSRCKKKGTVVSHIPKAMSKLELAALKEYLEMEGNLGEYWRHGGLD